MGRRNIEINDSTANIRKHSLKMRNAATTKRIK